jgi:hypothetical protein
MCFFVCDRILLIRIFMEITPKIRQNIEEFFNAFAKLTPDEKISFLAQIDKELKGKGAEDKNLYLTLMKAAREGKTILQTMQMLEKA